MTASVADRSALSDLGLSDVHVVGAGGAGMSGIASVLAKMGSEVTGSDLRYSPTVERLSAEGVPVAIGHDPGNIGSAKVIAVSSAVDECNPEVEAARGSGIRVMYRRDILPRIASSRSTIAVAGTHGKTTISSMLSLMMMKAGLEPSFIIGGHINEIGSGAEWGNGAWFVVEADESDLTFLSLSPEVAVVSNIELDHLEAYDHDPAALEAAFAEFLASARVRVVCADDDAAARIGVASGAVSYGTSLDADYRMTGLSLSMPVTGFDLRHRGEKLGRVELPMPGLHNALNAAAAIVTALIIGVSFDRAIQTLKQFKGVARRFEFRGEAAGVAFVDDYAHLPGEVSATLSAASTGHWRRVMCVFQPHRYSRTEAVGTEFADSFQDADRLVITDIYPAGEAPRPGVTAKIVLDAVLDAHPWSDVVWLRRLDEVADWLERSLLPGDLCLTLGAGDLTMLPDTMIRRLRSGTLPL